MAHAVPFRLGVQRQRRPSAGERGRRAPGAGGFPPGWVACALVACALAVFSLALGACGLLAPAPPPEKIPAAALAPYREFLTPGSLLPLRATGSISVLLAGEQETGDFIVSGNPAGEFSVQVLARITGSLVAELRLDEKRLLLLNFADKTFFEGDNLAKNRRRLLGLDITPAEFLMALTGRVPATDFAEAGGSLDRAGYAEMKRGSIRYLFALDSHGLPKNWVKEEGAKVVMRVEYPAYLLVYGSEGPPVRVPHKIRIFSRGDKPVMALGVVDFRPGASHLDNLEWAAPAEKGWRFRMPPDASQRLFRNL